MAGLQLYQTALQTAAAPVAIHIPSKKLKSHRANAAPSSEHRLSQDTRYSYSTAGDSEAESVVAGVASATTSISASGCETGVALAAFLALGLRTLAGL
jgi:hypothetical protein